MINDKAVECLYLRFGKEPFKVRDLGDEDLYELMMMVGLEMSPNDQSNRIRLGHALMETAEGQWYFNIPGGRFLIGIGIENPSDQDTGETATYYLL